MKTYEIIKNRRKELGLSADDVADALGVSRATVYRYESAYIEKLPVEHLVPLSRVLRCSTAYLMGWDDAATVPDQTPDPKESALLGMYRQLNPEGKEKLEERAEELIRMEYTLEADAKKGRDASA